MMCEKLETQIKQKSKNSEIIVEGDVNVKLSIERDNAHLKESRNGKIPQEMIERNNLEPTTLKAEKRHMDEIQVEQQRKKSRGDYIITSRTTAKNATHTIVNSLRPSDACIRC